MGERGRVSLSVWNGYELDKRLTHLTVYRQCSFFFAHSRLLAGHDTLGPTSPSFDIYTTIACFICICSHHHNVFRFILFHFHSSGFTWIALTLSVSLSFILFVARCPLRCFVLSNVSYSALDCTFYISIFIPFHSIFYLSFCFVCLSDYSFCSVSFLSLCITCSFDFVIFDMCAVQCTHPLQKSVESVCASDNHAKPFNNNIKYSLIRFALSRCTHGACAEELFLINLC